MEKAEVSNFRERWKKRKNHERTSRFKCGIFTYWRKKDKLQEPNLRMQKNDFKNILQMVLWYN